MPKVYIPKNTGNRQKHSVVRRETGVLAKENLFESVPVLLAGMTSLIQFFIPANFVSLALSANILGTSANTEEERAASMSSKNQYNVLVDMDEGTYSQPATIESDGLEFQDFPSSSGNKSTGARAPPPPASGPSTFFDSTQPRSNGSNKPIWSIEYYARFFDVDTSQVVERCLKTLYPVGDFANDTLNNQPDLYGPFWISTTVIFALYVCSSLAGSVVAYINNEEYVYDFRLLSFALVVVYLYSFLCPVIVWAATKYYGCQPSLLDIVDYYGYAMTIWVPVSLLCIIPIDIARWVFVGVAFGLTAYFLIKNLYIVISRADAKTSRIILLAILGAHAGFALLLKFAFYSYYIHAPSQPTDTN